MSAGQTRNFTVWGTCGIPTTAQAFTLNVTVVPHGRLGFLTLWPAGQTQPFVSTLNSGDGRVKANAAIIGAGTNGAVSVFVTDATDVILDITGYFVDASNAAALAFYTQTPCRLVDTRDAGRGLLGSPALVGGQNRTFPVLSSSCGVPVSANAYSLNFTVVPSTPLGYLTIWPTGRTKPLVSTLNAPTGTITANAAIIQGGNGGAIDAFATNNTHLIVDVNGSFGPPGVNGLSFYPMAPCRIVDTRAPTGGGILTGARDVDVLGSACSIPSTAKAYVINGTVVPNGPLGYLSLWPQGTPQPVVSTLNASDSAITSNMAIVPTNNGSISMFAAGTTHVILDITGYFAPTGSTPGSGPLSVTSATVGKDLQTTVRVSLPAPAASGGVTVSLLSGDAGKLLVGGTGKPSVNVTIPAGQSTVDVFIQGVASSGSVTLTAKAVGYTDGRATITLAPSGFVLAGPNGVGVSFQTYQSLVTTMTVYPARLDSAGKYVDKGQLRSSLPANVSVSLTSTPAGIGTVTSSVVFSASDSSAAATFTAVAAGTATITAGTPAGFTAVTGTNPANKVVATILASGITPPATVIVGRNLQTSASVRFNGVVGSSGATAVITSSDAARLKFAKTPTDAGSTSISITLPAGARGTPDFYIQGFDSSGTVNYSVSVAPWGSATGYVTLAPSGIVFTNSFGGVPNPILAAAGGSAVPVTIYSARLSSAGDFAQFQALAGGLSATANVTSGNSSYGTVNPAQVTIPGGQVSGTTQFQPAAAGSTNLSVSVPPSPAGFMTPSAQYRTVGVTVATSAVGLTLNGVAIGKNLQLPGGLFLSQAAPAGGLNVTVTSNNPSLLLVALRATDAGQNAITVTVPAGAVTASFYVQALGSSGTATYKASAAGYGDGTATITLTNSGVVLSNTLGNPAITTTVGGTAAVNVRMAQLDGANKYASTQQLRGGLSLPVTINSGNPGIATINSPVTIPGGADPATITTLVHGISGGSATIMAVQPPGYTAATNPLFPDYKPMPAINVTVN